MLCIFLSYRQLRPFSSVSTFFESMHHLITSHYVLCFDTDTRYPRSSIAYGIKDQQQHYEMMMTAEEIVRLVVDQTLPQILPEAAVFVKVSHG